MKQGQGGARASLPYGARYGIVAGKDSCFPLPLSPHSVRSSGLLAYKYCRPLRPGRNSLLFLKNFNPFVLRSMASNAFPVPCDTEMEPAVDFSPPPVLSSTETGSPTGFSFELAASSARLRTFLPVKIIERCEGGIKPFEISFRSEVLLSPIAGPYGNYVGSCEGERYVITVFTFQRRSYPMV